MNKYLKEAVKAVTIGIVLWIILLVLSLLNGNKLPPLNRLTINFIYTLFYTVVIYIANAVLFVKLDGYFKDTRFSATRLIIGFISSIILSIAVVFLLYFFDEVVLNSKPIQKFVVEQKFENYSNTILITFIISLIIHLFYLYKSQQENKIKEQKVIAGTASAKFETLKNQIDPHFLFNSLNVLSSLIEENPDQAQKFTTSLSKIYRYVLEQKDKELISVEEELSFAKTYMNLLKMRFENSITFELPTDFINNEAKVVPLSLQLLLENTIKHNVVSEHKPLHIKIYVENNYLIVQNNLQRKEVLQDRKGVGLQNIVNRYGLISERKVLIEENESFFKVMIPILTKQIAYMESQNIYNENMAYVKAKERVDQLKGFYGNLISYCCVIPILIIINVNTTDFQWFWFPVLGWGMGLIFHAIEVFGYGKNWEDRKIQEILKREENQSNKWN